MLIEPNRANVCFGCGGGNPRGMKLTFEQDDAARRIIGRFKLGAEYQGAFGIIHGGVIATVLDEVMGKVCRFRAVRAVTAEMNIAYLAPVRVDQELVSSYDVVAKLPGGEPVRFRCRKWRDQWSVTDTNRGVEIVQDNPRVEVVPVRFETY